MTTAQRMAGAPPPTVAQLQAHAQQVATAFDVRLIACPQLRPEEAFAVVQLRAVFASPVVDETTYAVQLHELGHLLAPSGLLRDVVRDGDPANLMRDEEDAAWAWVRHHAIVWTPVMETVAQWAEQTYAAPSSPAPPPQRDTPQPPSSRIDWRRY